MGKASSATNWDPIVKRRAAHVDLPAKEDPKKATAWSLARPGTHATAEPWKTAEPHNAIHAAMIVVLRSLRCAADIPGPG